MKITAYAASKQGPQTENNEDFVIVNNDLQLYVVCDGMGGHAAGQIAASIACSTVSRYIEEHLEELKKSKDAKNACRQIVEEAIHKACLTIFNHAKSNPGRHGMGTTISLALIHDSRLTIGHVGDSRVYLMRKGALDQISHDHTLNQELVDRKVMSESAARNGPFAHVLSRSLGISESVQVDLLQMDLLPGDRLLLCSDGVSDIFYEKAQLVSLLNVELQNCPEKLVSEALQRGARDDVSAIVIEVSAAESLSAEEKERVKQVTLTMDVLKKVYLFENLATDELLHVVERCSIVQSKRDDVLMREGELGDSLYVILEGFFEVSRGGKVLTGLGEGNHVGEMALLSGTNRTADVRALSPGLLLKIMHNDFMTIADENPKIGVKLLSALAKELSARLKAMNQFTQS